jgi:hypothetical protein
VRPENSGTDQSSPPGLILGYSGHGKAALASAVERMGVVFSHQTGMTKFAELELS